MCVFFSGEEPESLRGLQSVFDTMMLGLRLGESSARHRDHAKDNPVHEMAGGDARYPDHERVDL